jgi:dTDP-4-amino-4,6-dideoxygalactose transaminase
MNMKIPLFKVNVSEEAISRVSEVLRSGFIGQGQVVNEFESELCNYLGTQNVLTLNSATAAEHLALHLLKKKSAWWTGMEEGDEVLTTPLTCTATNWPILANGFNIKWVDIDPATLNMDLDDLARKITAKTKVIVVVHWGGYPIDLDRLKQIQLKCFDLYGFEPIIIEDCAHAMGAKYNGKLIGSHGNICTFSLQAIKHVTSGDGGILILPYKQWYDRAKKLRWYGIDRDSPRRDFRCEPDIEEWGFKFHMNDINAAIGVENFKQKDQIIEKHKQNAAYYDKELHEVAGITLLERNHRAEGSFWIYSLLVENREAFQLHMEKKGISTSQVHQRNDQHSCVKEFRTILPNLDSVIDKIISIPVGWWVTDEGREYIVNSIKEGW